MELRSRAEALHRRIVVAEGHRDVYEQLYYRNRGHASPLRTFVLPRLRSGGVSIVTYAICGDTIDHANGTDRPMWAAMENIDQFYLEADQPGSGLQVILAREDVPERPDGAVHFLLHFEGGKPLEGSVSALRNFYRLGLRSMQVVHNVRNELGDGVTERGSGGGLTRVGEAVVREAHRLGMVVDVSHASEATFYHVLRVSERPVVASHSNCAAVFPHVRSLTDDQLRALRDNGGLVGINLIAAMVHRDRPTLDQVVDHVDHLAELLGPDRVYVGADFTKYDGPRSPRETRFASPEGVFVQGLEEADQYPNLTEALLRRGYGEDDVAGIMGGNFARFLRQTLRSRDDQSVSPTE